MKTYEVSIDGYAPALYVARSMSKARYLAFRDFTDVYTCSFHDFLCRSRLRQVANREGVGERILVAGEPATRVSARDEPIRYLYDHSDVVYRAHASEVRGFARAQAECP